MNKPDWLWPGGKRVAVIFNVAFEAWSDGKAPGISPMQVEARTEGKPGTRMMVGDTWAVFNLELPGAAPYARYKRINLHADRTWKSALYRAGSDAPSYTISPMTGNVTVWVVITNSCGTVESEHVHGGINSGHRRSAGH